MMDDKLQIVQEHVVVHRFSTRDFEEPGKIGIEIYVDASTFQEKMEQFADRLNFLKACVLEAFVPTLEGVNQMIRGVIDARNHTVELICKKKMELSEQDYERWRRNFDRYTRRYARGPKRKCKGSRK